MRPRPSSRPRPASLVRPAAIAAAAGLALAAAPAALGQSTDRSVGLVQQWAAPQWSVTPMEDGTAEVASLPADAATWSYRAEDPDGTGLPLRTATLRIPVEQDGVVRFRYRWIGDHGADLDVLRWRVESLGPGLATEDVFFDDQPSPSAPFAMEGTVELEVVAGGFIAVQPRIESVEPGAGVRGTVALSEFEHVTAGFRGDAAVGTWDLIPVAGGASGLDPDSGETDAVELTYTAGSPGVPVGPTTAGLQRTATRDARASLDYAWSGIHGVAGAVAGAELFARRSNGAEVTATLVPEQSVSGAFQFSGSGTIDVQQGQVWGIRVFGENDDAFGLFNGSLSLSGLERAATSLGGLAPVGSWQDQGYEFGPTTLTAVPSRGRFSYAVDLGDPGSGVPERSATFDAGVSPANGNLRFDWELAGYHAFFNADARLEVVYVEGGEEIFTDTLVDGSVSGPFARSGSYSQLIFAGETVRIRVTGGNGDSDSELRGDLTLRNFSAPVLVCPADQTGDGTVDFDDLLAVLSGFGECDAPPCSGDVTSDGTVDFDDLLTVLGSFGPCD
jgi:hypothetical protein